jgi:hypothetical protein
MKRRVAARPSPPPTPSAESDAAAAGAAEFRAGLQKMIEWEEDDAAARKAAAEAAHEKGFALPWSPPYPSWAESAQLHDELVHRNEELIPQHPAFFTAYAYGVLSRLALPACRFGVFQTTMTEEALRFGFRPPNVTHGRRLQLAGGSTSTNVCYVVGFSEQRGRGGPLANPAESMIFFLLVRHWRRHVEETVSWVTLARIVRAWGWKPSERAWGDPPTDASVARILEERVARLESPPYDVHARAAAEWFEAEFPNGWSTGIDL